MLSGEYPMGGRLSGGLSEWMGKALTDSGFFYRDGTSQQAALKRFWLSADPHGPAYLADAETGINIPGGGAPP